MHKWSKRWERHADVNPTFWDPVVDFVRSAFPLQEPMECPPLTLTCRSLTEQLLNLLAEVEAGGSWPSQYCKVSS